MEELLKEMRKGWFARIKATGISPKQFCRQTGISYDTLRRTKNPQIRTLDKIEKAVVGLENGKL